MVMACVKCFVRDAHWTWLHKEMPKLTTCKWTSERSDLHSFRRWSSDNWKRNNNCELVTHFRQDGIIRSGQELQDLWFGFSTVQQTQRDHWQQSVVSVWDAPPASVPAVIQPNPLPPLSQARLNQHMAYCLLGHHHHHHHHCRDIVLALCERISNSHPPYLRAPPLPTLSPKLARSRPHTWRGYVTELRSRAVLSWHELNGLAAVCQGLFISQCRHWLILLPQALGMEWGTRFELSTV